MKPALKLSYHMNLAFSVPLGTHLFWVGVHNMDENLSLLLLLHMASSRDHRQAFESWIQFLDYSYHILKMKGFICCLFNSYSASHDNWCTGTLWNRVITAQCEGMGEVGSARYEPALLPPCPSIRVLSYSNCQEIHSRQQTGLAV